LFEYFDAGIFASGELLSGHTLKHLFAAMTPATMLYALHARRVPMRSDQISLGAESDGRP
jgi:hypothetical protein